MRLTEHLTRLRLERGRRCEVKLWIERAAYEMTLQEIGDTFGVKSERVRQIREKAIRRLRQESKSHILKKYLG